ncbi:MAG: NifU N-terminal domain-containing protein [Planctomycetota bacterium]
MPRVLRYDPTPNPDALKLMLDRAISDRPRSFMSAEDAASDPVAGPIFATGSVRAVLINGDWMSVNKLPEADWKTIKPVCEKALRELDA